MPIVIGFELMYCFNAHQIDNGLLISITVYSFHKDLTVIFFSSALQLLLSQLEHYHLKCFSLKLWRFWKRSVNVWLPSFLDAISACNSRDEMAKSCKWCVGYYLTLLWQHLICLIRKLCFMLLTGKLYMFSVLFLNFLDLVSVRLFSLMDHVEPLSFQFNHGQICRPWKLVRNRFTCHFLPVGKLL